MLVITISIILIIFSFVMTIFAFLLLRRRKAPGAITSIFFMIGGSIYSFGYAMELLHNSLETILFWIRVEYIGISFIPAIWLIMAIQYTKNKNQINPKLFWPLWIIPILTIVTNYTNELHYLYYTNIELVQNQFLTYASVSRGPFYWIHIAYFNLSFIVSSVLYLIMYQKTIKTVRRQISFMLIGSLSVWIFTLIYILNLTNGIDIIPFAAFIMGVFFFFGLYKFKLFKINPVVIEQLVHSMEDAMILFDHEDEVMISNEAAKELFPVLNQKKGSIGIDEICQSDTLFQSLFEDHSNKRIEWIFRCAQKVKFFDVSMTMIYSNNNLVGKILLLTDITEKKKIISQLNDYAYKDGLTDIYNRRFFKTKLDLEYERSIRYGFPLSVILLDIDLFKLINDKYGHHAGDQVLVELVTICNKYIRKNDVFARYGGEEFIIMLPETTVDTAYEIAEVIRKAIEDYRMVFEETTIQFTSSFGVAQNTKLHLGGAEDLVTLVDRAMYQSKQSGRNLVTKIE
jgi:diguanylate cyclase (GGDEF)-like protein